MKYVRECIIVLILAMFSNFIFPVLPIEACGKNSLFEECINVGGYKLYIHSEGSRKPVVLYDAGNGDTSEVWSMVQHRIADKVKSVSYDRAGLGMSEDSPFPRISYNMVMEWHKLLEKAKIKGPFILVGHSSGGYNVRLFTSMYPKEVAGLILVDSSHEDQDARLMSTLPFEIQQIIKTQFSEGTYEDFLKSGEQARATRNCLKNIPLTVITAGNHGFGEESEKIWIDMQKDLASMSDYSKHIIAHDSTHYIQIDQPEIIIKAIQDMICLLNRMPSKNK